MTRSRRRAARRASAYIATGMLAGIALGLSVLVGGWSTSSGGRPASDDDIAGPARIIDGDTVDIHGTRIRLAGIDAPERAQTCRDAQGTPYRCGEEASQALAGLVGGQTVHCIPQGIDRYGRTLAVCSAGAADLNGQMVRNGWAVAYTHYSWAYFGDEVRARARSAGIWSGNFERPWRWRQEHRERR